MARRILMLLLLVPALAAAHDYAPAKAQTKPVLLRGGDLYTVSHGVLARTDILFENGKITKIGPGITPPEGAEVIDVSGKRVYPGLIAPATQLGLVEIDSTKATHDDRETGKIHPEVATHTAFNPDSEIIPTVRNHGVAIAQVAPSNGVLQGRSYLALLDGWTKEDSAVRLVDGVFMGWPSVSAGDTSDEKAADKRRKEMAADRRELRQAFADARAYLTARKAGVAIPSDIRWDAMIPVLEKSQSLYVVANDYRQIIEAIDFAKEQDVRMVIVGGSESPRAATRLRDAKIPVILRAEQSLPVRQDDAYDSAYRAAALLHDAGVAFCLTSGSSWEVRNLPLQAGQAAAFGLPQDVALRSITLSAAEILGISSELGSLDEGKRATLFISTGDVMDTLGQHVERLWIDGRDVNLDDKQRELWRKYAER
jgi:imidazolonepropionase-like amidohydrolase